VAAGLAAVVVAGCSGGSPDPGAGATASGSPTSSPSPSASPDADPAPDGSAPTPSRSSAPSPGRTADPRSAPAVAEPSDGRPRRALLSIPALGLRDLLVVPYRGRTDDAVGTVIQDRGVAAAPHGPRGGVGPGGVGNYQVTAHRTSSTQAFRRLPELRRGHRVVVEAGRTRYVYLVRRTRQTSFRSPRSLAEQRAPVPGRPGAPATTAFLTLSTCATPEDHAAGNYWSDEFSNPEHRIDKVAVLVGTRALPS
jgi:sortase A